MSDPSPRWKNWVIVLLTALLAASTITTVLAATRTVETTANVEVTVWQRVSDGALYLSTRPEGGDWTTHNEALDMSALSRSGNFRQGSAITVGVPVTIEVEAPEPVETETTPEPTTAPTPSRQELPTRDADDQDKWEYVEGFGWFVYAGAAWWSGQTLQFHCLETQLGTVVHPYASFDYGDDYTIWDTVTVSHRIDGGSVVTGQWSTPTIYESATAPDAFLTAIQHAQTVTLQATGSDAVTLSLGGYAGVVMDDLGCFG